MSANACRGHKPEDCFVLVAVIFVKGPVKNKLIDNKLLVFVSACLSVLSCHAYVRVSFSKSGYACGCEYVQTHMRLCCCLLVYKCVSVTNFCF